MKKEFIIVISVIVLSTIVGCIKDESVEKEVLNLKGKVIFNLDLVTEYGMVPDEFIAIADKIGWKYSELDNSLVKTFPLKNTDVALLNGEKYVSDNRGRLFLPTSQLDNLQNAAISYKDNLLDLDLTMNEVDKELQLTTKLQDYMLRKSHNNTCGEEHRNENCDDDGKTEDEEPMYGRCMDYNGPFSDGGNYPKSHWRAYTNFIGSDCDIALLYGYCYLDHYVGGCEENHGQLCSSLIGHNPDYHVHDMWPYNDTGY